MHFVKGRDIVVPLKQSCGVPDTLDRPLVQTPNWIKYRVIVGVEDVLFKLGVAGDVNLRDALDRNAVDVVEGVESMILGRDVDVVDVEQDSAVGRLHHLVQKLPFGHLGFVELSIATNVFNSDGNLEKILDLSNSRSSCFHSFAGIR